MIFYKSRISSLQDTDKIHPRYPKTEKHTKTILHIPKKNRKFASYIFIIIISKKK